MAKENKSQKKVVKTVKTISSDSKKASVSKASRSTKSSGSKAVPLIFDKQNYIFMGVGVLFIALGLILMSGGGSDSPEVFDSERIYSFGRITLAPFLIIIGLLVEVYAIFKK